MNLQHISYQLGELNGKMDRVLALREEDAERYASVEKRLSHVELRMAKAVGWVAGVSSVVTVVVSLVMKVIA